ncbi:BTAD domain-containing putative transcriptional regulator [Streptomyces sp. NPDC015171]|jgi:SARP family transcriptional regulator, regulator of embCAB operon|uniref:AfsR/SARP family transcriptional regulator n=1 Tax=Streptomyces sp. NPDC015171 TaxID=3364945 RepID=UPI0037002EA4
MNIGMLGPLRIEVNDSEIDLSGAKLRDILAVLALRAGEVIRRDELVEELGLASTTRNSVNAVHAHIRRLRRWLEKHGIPADVIETVDSGYRMNVDRACVDAHRFSDLARQGLGLAPATPSVVATILEEALSLWRADALLDSRQGPLVTSAADELHHWRSTARDALLDAWLALGQDNKVILSAPRFIADDPLNESIRVCQLIALRRMGRYTEAVRAYQNAERILSQELSVEPGPELRTAHRVARRRISSDIMRERAELARLA